jgi:hypothetical protein
VREYDALDAEGQEWYFCQPLDAGRIAPESKPKTQKKAAPRRKPAKRKAARRKLRR